MKAATLRNVSWICLAALPHVFEIHVPSALMPFYDAVAIGLEQPNTDVDSALSR